MSPRGSRLAANAPGPDHLDPERLARQRQRIERLYAAAEQLIDAEIPDVEDHEYAEERTDVAARLREHGCEA